MDDMQLFTNIANVINENGVAVDDWDTKLIINGMPVIYRDGGGGCSLSIIIPNVLDVCDRGGKPLTYYTGTREQLIMLARMLNIIE